MRIASTAQRRDSPAKRIYECAGKKMPGGMKPPGWQAFLLSHAKAPLREEKRDAVAKLVTTRINSNHPHPVLATIF
jgi:hypothetical protein